MGRTCQAVWCHTRSSVKIACHMGSYWHRFRWSVTDEKNKLLGTENVLLGSNLGAPKSIIVETLVLTGVSRVVHRTSLRQTSNAVHLSAQTPQQFIAVMKRGC